MYGQNSLFRFNLLPNISIHVLECLCHSVHLVYYLSDSLLGPLEGTGRFFRTPKRPDTAKWTLDPTGYWRFKDRESPLVW